jgi:epoxyqueuosine reductase
MVREIALEAGFDLVRFGPIDLGAHADHFLAWLDAGRAGGMDYLARNRDRIADPRRHAPQARSAIALGYDYGRGAASLAGGGRVARYAAGRDYHRSVGNAAARVRRRLEREGVPRGTMRIGTDAVPLLERALAVEAGIGFLAKSAMVIAPTRGPYLFLAEVLAPLDLPPDGPAAGTCGTCRACLDACPTGAIVAPFQVDARLCLSYTTIELRGPIPRELRAPQADWFFGCDVCLEVCPFTSRSRAADRSAVLPADLSDHRVLETYSLVGVLELSEAEYAERWTGTAMRRATRDGLRRNAAVVLGNLGDEAAVPALRRVLEGDPEPVVRGHAAWALGRLHGGRPALARAAAREADAYVSDEINAALDQAGDR